MPRKKKKTPKQSSMQCKFCLKSFTNLGSHFYQSPICSEYHLNNDLTLVTTNDQLNNSRGVTTQEINSNTFDYYHTNDMNSNWFETNDNQSICTTNQLRSTENSIVTTNLNNRNNLNPYSNSNTPISTSTNQPPREILTLSTQLEEEISISSDICDDESLVSGIFIDTYDAVNDDYINTCNQIDTMITSLTPTISLISIANINRNITMGQNNIPCLYDFTQLRISVLQQMIYLPVDHGMIASIRLLQIMSDGNMANCHYSKLIKWHLDTICRTSSTSISTTYPIIKSRKVIIDYLHKLLYQMKSDEFSMRPIHRVIMLPSGRTTKISKFDLKSSIASMMTDPELMKRDNIYLNDKCYINPIMNKSNTIVDIHNGSAFLNAYKKYCSEPNDILVPIIPFIDGTPIDPYGRNKLEVVMFTLGLFKQNIRHKTSAWHIAGYIPDPCNENSGQHDFNDLSQKQQKIAKRKDYHQMLQYILNDFVALEQSDGIKMELPNYDGTKLITYRFKFCIMFIIGDAVGHDKLCDRFASYGKHVTRLCRDCDCPNTELNNHEFNCNYTKRSDLLAMSAKELLDISYYKIDNNALDKLSFGGNIYGMNGCLPPEPLHQLNQGVFKKLLDYFEDCITTKGNNMLDKIVKYLSMNSHRQSDRQYSRIDLFKDGLDKCQLSGTEIIHKIFMLYISLIQTYVINCLPETEESCKQRYKKKQEKKQQQTNPNDDQNETYINMVSVTKHYYNKIGKSKEHLLNWIRLLEATLCLDVWINQDEFLMSDLKCNTINDSKADIAIRNYLKLYTSIIEDPIGNGTQTSKIHWLLHIPRYIREFGPPKAYNGQTPEHCLSPLVKDAARRTQLRPSSLVEQSCERYFENIIIQRSDNILKQQNAIDVDRSEPQYVTNLKQKTCSTDKRAYHSIGEYDIHIDNLGMFKTIIWNKCSSKKKHVMYNVLFVQSVIDRLRLSDFGLQSNVINCVTTLHIMEPNKTEKLSFRADPYYHKRPWHDWCMSTWSISNDNSLNNNDMITNMYPSRIMMFIDTKDMNFNQDISKLGRYLAVVKATEIDTRLLRNKPNSHCKLITTYDTDKYIRIIGCNSIVKPVFVIPDVDDVKIESNKLSFNSDQVIMMKNKKEWSKMFIESFWD